MTSDPLELDLTPDDDATLDELDPEDEHPLDPEPSPDPVAATPDMETQVREEAKRLRDNADGHTQAEKIKNAIDEADETLAEHLQQYRQVISQKKETEQRMKRLELAEDRVLDQPDDCQIVQTIAGGISLEVPPDTHDTLDDDEIERDAYTRSDLCDEINETIDALDDQLDSFDETEQKLEMALKKTKGAVDLLRQTQDMLGSEDFEVAMPHEGAGRADQPYGTEQPR